MKLKIKKNLKMPDGIQRKLLNVNLANSLGWRAKTSLKDGLKITLQDYSNAYRRLQKARINLVFTLEPDPVVLT